ncbi:GNAT family N-acetyltransferase [Ilyomonas limi]|uniref:GNAT family N-acetyltransferase n=1 Tax=Ilyomonas limi TaxID=2575867 RepID=A0A4U3KXQ8_9BACT|nr:GNAT family N-acetyltransferase [Ilyomonas limi]TKK67240.1 GNAT family N-acetyltransferase [Ilyomonas limi]
MSPLIFLPIDIDEAKNTQFNNHPECVEILQVYPPFYKKVGFNKPWIGYFITFNGVEIIGGGGYKGKPINGKVEIAYGTFKNYQGQGIGTEICRQLTLLAFQTDPTLQITARTLPDNLASIRILKKNGFKCLGTVYDEEDGNVLEWEFEKHSAKHQLIHLPGS